MQIIDIKTDIVKKEEGLNLYIEKAKEFEKSLSLIKDVTKENYEDCKKLRTDIVTGKTSVEKTRVLIKAPVIQLGKAIDRRAEELAEPFANMQKEIQDKLDIYEKEEKERIQKEKNRIEGIIEEIHNFTDLEKLSEFYKSLDKKDQIKKGIIAAGTLAKNTIIENNKKQAIEEIKKQIASCDTIEGLEEHKNGEYSAEQEIINAINERKEKIEFNIKQEELKKEQEKIKKQEIILKIRSGIISAENLNAIKDMKKTIQNNGFSLDEFPEYQIRYTQLEEKEKEAKKMAEEALKKEKEQEEERQKMLKEKIDIAKQKIELFNNIEELNNYYNSFADNSEIEDEILDDYNKRKNEIIKIEEDKKREKEVEKNNEELDPNFGIVGIDNGKEGGEQTVREVVTKKSFKNEMEKILEKGFDEPSTEMQFESCKKVLDNMFDYTSNKTELLIDLRDYLLNNI